MKPQVRFAVLALAAVLLAGCVAGSGESGQAASGGLLSQFFLGLWHGIIGPVMLIVEVINHFAPHALPWKTHLYETRATGVAYDVGFYIGLLGGPSFGFLRARRR